MLVHVVTVWVQFKGKVHILKFTDTGRENVRHGFYLVVCDKMIVATSSEVFVVTTGLKGVNNDFLTVRPKIGVENVQLIILKNVKKREK